MKEYNVWVFNHNTQKIELYNILNHRAFAEEIDELLEECEDIKEFSKELHAEAVFYFWCKAEWEIIMVPWCGCRDEEKAQSKIDVFSQLDANWDVFVKMLWEDK